MMRPRSTTRRAAPAGALIAAVLGFVTAAAPVSAGCETERPNRFDLTTAAVSLERTVCYGTCPSYVVEITGTGEVRYLGRRFVAVVGPRTAQLERAEFVDLLRRFWKIDFFSLCDEYRNTWELHVDDGWGYTRSVEVTDLPKAIITLRVGDFEKRVVDYDGGPPELADLAGRIDRAAGVEGWVDGPRP